MSYAVYSTRGFIIGSSPSGEASKLYVIYTEDFGLIRARAQSVRLLASKLRYNLDEYSYGVFSLVRGKEFWRVTGAETLSVPTVGRSVRARILTLLKRLIQGEEPNPALFSVLTAMKDYEDNKTKDTVHRDVFEVLVLVHVLSSLGYMDKTPFVETAGSVDFGEQGIQVVREKYHEAISAINKALRETHL